MDIFIAHPETREYLGPGQADPDPLQPGKWLIPSHAYADAPPVAPHGKAVQRGEDGKAWLLVDDCRGAAYEVETGIEVDWQELGPLPEHLSSEPRPSASHRWLQAAWVLDPEVLHKTKTREIDLACEAAITNGFRSSALGALHSYTSEITDQLNLMDAVSSGLPSLYPCRDEIGIRLFREHSAEQLRIVSSDFSTYKLKLLIYSGDLKARLDSALAEGNLAAMEQVVWGSEP